MKIFRNPIAFTPLPVTIITSIVYGALIVALLVLHLVVPSAPENATPLPGVNLTEAWRDLQTLSSAFHPYNSRQNDEIRNWLLTRIESILERNDVPLSENASAVVFSDLTSNVTFAQDDGLVASQSDQEPGLSVYFEGTNIIVYIRGSEDESGDWWSKGKRPSTGGVLVNAHYDSVSTGFGATDDGVGVVTILQLVKHFTTLGQQPKRGIIALLNNGEEDFLNGARAFTQHPTSRFAHTFLNLEGAGAGGRALLFRATDTEVVRAYQKSEHPFASVLTSDAFKRGTVHSETDFVVFNGVLGLRGLDLAFMEPRARYHTEQDDTRYTSVDSLWHMLSAALSIVEELSSDTSATFDGKNPESGKVASGRGSDPVYFDLFGSVLVVFRLRTLFALSVTLLVVAPVFLIVIGVVLYKVDKLYLFSSSRHHHHSNGDHPVLLRGWHGISRYPFIFIVSSAGAVGLAFLITKLNPFIIYSSPYPVWSMIISAWVFIMWFLSRMADFLRPSAFHRVYALLWMFGGCWLILVVVTVLEQRLKIASGYFVLFYFAAISLAAMISLLELFGLPRKSAFADEVENHADETSPNPQPDSITNEGPSADDQPEHETNHDGEVEEEATESTSLLPNERQPTFARYAAPHPDPQGAEPTAVEKSKDRRVYGFEQPWSWALPTWTWVLQFLLIAPIVIILLGQMGLLLISALHQTLADGNAALTVYIGVAVFAILIFAPLGPFLHRYTYHIPVFLLLVFAATLIYNLVAFPFSANNRLKLFFLQKVDLDTGLNEVSLTGVGGVYLSQVIRSLPSLAGQTPECSKSLLRKDLTQCGWQGIPPRVVKNTQPEVPPSLGYSDWLSFNITRNSTKTEARFHVWGRNTRACKIQFKRPISDFRVDGAGEDKRISRVSKNGCKEIRLWSRTWEKAWNVDVMWEVDEDREDHGNGLDGRIVCLWSDDNETGAIPAIDEVRHFAPEWVAVQKLADGLVEGSKAFLA